MKKTKNETKHLTRAPVVTIMGHVDHGKTTLLDYIRKTKIAEKEHGGITQHVGAYQVDVKGKKITFIDTPGHEAFSAMRARGANVTDIVILIVAADDGVMPQTRESIAHIKTANVPVIVAINKMDAPGASLEKVKKGLATENVLVEGYGGDVVAVPVSAKTGQGVDELLDMINLVAEMAELKDESHTDFEGVVIESSLDRFRGPLASILVKKGKLTVGEQIFSDTASGKVKALINSSGENIKEATVSTPVEILGFVFVPAVGEVVRKGQKPLDQSTQQPSKISPLDLLSKTDTTEINLIIKADVAGSLEAIVAALNNLTSESHKVKIIHKETGEINESDVLLAASTKAIIIGFNVKIAKAAEKLAEEDKVMVRNFNIIYELIDELKEGIEALIISGQEKILGRGKIIAQFDTSHGQIAGTKITEGRLAKGDRVAIYRGEERLTEARIKSIRHLNNEISTAKENEECGILLTESLEFAIGDIIVAVS